MSLPRLPRAVVAATVAFCGLLPAAAHADVVPDGTGEPAYTNSANNTQFVRWNGVAGGSYRVKLDYYANNVLQKQEGPYSMPVSGSTWINWSGVVPTPLAEGSQYGICARGEWSDVSTGGLWFPDGQSSCSYGAMTGQRTHTTIDRTKPTAGLTLAAGAAFAKTSQLPVQMSFTDNLAGPFPANFLCVQPGSTNNACDTSKGYVYGYSPDCSQPAGPGRDTTFNCTMDVAAGSTPAPDGPVAICAIAADAAIPDNPYNPDQRANATQANLSDASCDTVTLDRLKPDLAATMSPATDIKAGDAIAFDAVAADATSGVKNSYAWTWGDGTRSSGRAVSHTYAAPGIYTITLKATDTAGTASTATRRITVGAAGTPVPPVDAPITSTIDVSAPASVTVPSTGTGNVAVTLTPSAAGRATFTLLRGTTQVAVGGRPVVAGKSTYSLKLPANAPAGAHTLRVVYTPTGRAAITKSLKTTLVSATTGFTASTATAAPAEAKVSAKGLKRVLPKGATR